MISTLKGQKKQRYKIVDDSLHDVSCKAGVNSFLISGVHDFPLFCIVSYSIPSFIFYSTEKNTNPHQFFRQNLSQNSIPQIPGYKAPMVSTTDISRIIFAGPATARITEPITTAAISKSAATGAGQAVPHLEVIRSS